MFRSSKDFDDASSLGEAGHLKRQLEQSRINQLYNQNINGLLALSACSTSYLVVAWQSMPHEFLVIWFSILLSSGLARMIATLRWRAIRNQRLSAKKLTQWLLFLRVSLLISGLSWGIIGLQISKTSSPVVQLVAALVIALMGTGAVVVYSAECISMYAVFLPSFLLLSAGFLQSPEAKLHILGWLSLIYTLIGVGVGRTMTKFVTEFLQLNIKNAELANDLKRDREALRFSEEQLRLALDASNAVAWRWDPKTGVFQSRGLFKESLDSRQNMQIGTSIDSCLDRVYPSDRDLLMSSLLALKNKRSDMDIEFRMFSSNDELRWKFMRGRNLNGSDISRDLISGIICDITEKKKQEALSRERDLHRAASRAKSLFLANASHEIRTPLAAINGFAESLLQSELLPQVKADLQIILRNGTYLASLVNNLLDLSKIETKGLYIQSGYVLTEQAITDAILVVKSALGLKNLSFNLMYETPIPLNFHSDPIRFRQIVINLLTNAIKFTEKGGISVFVSFFEADGAGHLKIRVRDTGIGIPSETKLNLFTPFARGNEEAVQRVQGSGLGLALSRNLARLLNGEVSLVQSEIGSGSEFEFTLDIGSVEQVSLIQPKGFQSTNSFQIDFLQQEKMSLSGSKILIVDDSPDLAALINRVLERRGAICEAVANGLQAVERASVSYFDIILMDIKMPVMDGYQASSRLRELGCLRPIIAVTAQATPIDRELCYQAGCDDYLRKPIEFRQLLETILKWKDLQHPTNYIPNPQCNFST